MEWLQVLAVIVPITILVIGLNRSNTARIDRIEKRQTETEERLLGAISGLSDRMDRMETRLLGAIRELAGRIELKLPPNRVDFSGVLSRKLL